jgi:S1-C subfamily serine protease
MTDEQMSAFGGMNQSGEGASLIKQPMSGLPALVLSIVAILIALLLSVVMAFFVFDDGESDQSVANVESSATAEGVSTGESDSDGSTGDLFAAPEDLGSLIEKVRASTVTILCRDSQGSGWVLDLGDVADDSNEEANELDRKYPNEVITNHHVIEDCVDTPRKVRAQTGPEEFDAYLYSWDEENDLALVAITQDVPYLEVSEKPEPGWWAMAVGTPYGLEGSISIGNVMNLEGFEVYATSPLNSGNSGGPMVNSLGQVMGTSTATLIGDDDPQDWNIAMGIPALCVDIVLCDPTEDESWFWE